MAGTNHSDPQKIQIVTLENAVYMGMKNDLAFVLDTGLHLYEHQSTWNPNLPLRDLFYIASEYQRMGPTNPCMLQFCRSCRHRNFWFSIMGRSTRKKLLT